MGCGVTLKVELPALPEVPPKMVNPGASQQVLQGNYTMSEYVEGGLEKLFEFSVLESTLIHRGYAFKKISPEIQYNEHRKIKALGIFLYGEKKLLVRLEEVTGQSDFDTEINTVLKFEDGAFTLGGDSLNEQKPMFFMSPN